MSSPSWPALEGAAAYLFVIAVAWSVPEAPETTRLVLPGMCVAALGGATVALAYVFERFHEKQQPGLHGTGTTLIVLGTLALLLLPLV